MGTVLQDGTVMGGISVSASDDSIMYSIIIVNYNGGKLLLNCIKSVLHNTKHFELILVDNNSTDGSGELEVQLLPTTKLIRNPSNMGFSRANNIGVRIAKGEWIVLLNPDTIVTQGWIDKLTECATGTGAGIVGPKLLRFDRQTIDSAGHVFLFRSGDSFDRGAGVKDLGQYDKEKLVPSVCFAAAVIRRSVFGSVGFLDEKMALYFEDVDYCIRARISGWNILYCPLSVVYHVRGGVSSSSWPSTMQKHAVAYPLRIILKSYGLTSMIEYGGTRVLRELLSVAAGIKNRDILYSKMYLYSLLWNVLNLPVRERREVQSRRHTAEREIIRVADESTRTAQGEP